ncbi:uncharacterized protein RCO7_10512 [Rhynchosporium graminicola]|uniref:Isopenicillin N synthase-like Fe(2+) 2OG dioxygenase domain-containing protein n=1 Tax=Rhynchosporium graminicola TaxID=2792576 RepID=A0A1E1LIW8_9HELO|nr:uncharacterized protein RCO7_10512 [Rhynchosporium commune]
MPSWCSDWSLKIPSNPKFPARFLYDPRLEIPIFWNAWPTGPDILQIRGVEIDQIKEVVDGYSWLWGETSKKSLADAADEVCQWFDVCENLTKKTITDSQHHIDAFWQTMLLSDHVSQLSGDQVRLIKSPPQPASDQGTVLGKHTDFGSITILFNRLGDLQILLPPPLTPAVEDPQWTYVKPLPGHFIVTWRCEGRIHQWSTQKQHPPGSDEVTEHQNQICLMGREKRREAVGRKWSRKMMTSWESRQAGLSVSLEKRSFIRASVHLKVEADITSSDLE